MLVRLMYASRATEPLGVGALASILRRSHAHNPGAGITGVLCHSGSIFLQVLEGGRSQVSALYNRIATDPRHHDVVLLTYEEIAERSFAGWSMGLVDLGKVNPALLLKYSESAVLDPYAVSGKASAALFAELIASAAVSCPP